MTNEECEVYKKIYEDEHPDKKFEHLRLFQMNVFREEVLRRNQRSSEVPRISKDSD